MLSKKERYRRIIEYFTENQPVAETELDYVNPYELLVATILSAQCTDKRVNLITPAFFSKYPDPGTLAVGNLEEVTELIRSCTYFNNKAKNLIGMARTLLSEFNGIVPSDTEELQKLPGVGRKTANVVASVVFHKPAMAVDTHVFRVSARLGLTTAAKTPYAAEMQLIKHIPQNKIPIAHHWLILHGRYICQARKPRCEQCPLNSMCRYFELHFPAKGLAPEDVNKK